MSWDRMADWILSHDDSKLIAQGHEYFRIVRENVIIYYANEPMKSSGHAEDSLARDLQVLDKHLRAIEARMDEVAACESKNY